MTAYTPTPVFSVPVNITANGFFIMTVLKNMEETDIASHYDIMVVPEKSNANFCPSMRVWCNSCFVLTIVELVKNAHWWVINTG